MRILTVALALLSAIVPALAAAQTESTAEFPTSPAPSSAPASPTTTPTSTGNDAPPTGDPSASTPVPSSRAGVPAPAQTATPYATSPSAAPPAAPYGAPPPSQVPAPYVAPPPFEPAPPVRGALGVREHDGFYLSIGLGLSFVADSISSTRFDEARLSGFGLADQLAIGGTPVRGLVLGGALEDASTFAPTLTVDGRTRSDGPNTFGLSIVGPFAEYYFDPSQGLHAEVLLGLSFLTADDSRDLPVGFAGSLGVGYEWWVGPQSSVGFLARVAYSRLTYDPNRLDESHSVIAPSIVARYTYH